MPHPVFYQWYPREVSIGGTELGGSHPVRLQSMTNTNTLDTRATVEQCIRLANAGADYIRLATPSPREAEHLAVIKKEMVRAGYHIPLIADVHFNPTVAEIAARLVEKVRINPGNYADNPRNTSHSKSKSGDKSEVERISEKLLPLLDICKQYGTVIRIGTNHGSLSQRIMDQYGDSPLGMAESAMEFVRICHGYGFHNLVLSMKSSNVRVMVAATRILAAKMIEENMQYPLHLGVTEAGNGLDGRVKSAVGIGTLLADGLGDTIRVSLTEPPENEIPVARMISEFYPKQIANRIFSGQSPTAPADYALFGYQRRRSTDVGVFGGSNPPTVAISDEGFWLMSEKMEREGWLSEFSDDRLTGDGLAHEKSLKLFDIAGDADISNFLQTAEQKSPGMLVPVLRLKDQRSLDHAKRLIGVMELSGLANPLLSFVGLNMSDGGEFAITAALLHGPLLVDGYTDGIVLENKHMPETLVAEVGYTILQATRSRIVRTEYIACPGCGRTKYDLEGALEKVKKATSHLKGLKIAVMGCIVNGPGEMADADYGYVGQGNGKVTLYAGKVAVRRGISEAEAVDELIRLLKEQGRWQNP